MELFGRETESAFSTLTIYKVSSDALIAFSMASRLSESYGLMMTLSVLLGAICARCFTWSLSFPILTYTSSNEAASSFPALLFANISLKLSTIL